MGRKENGEYTDMILCWTSVPSVHRRAAGPLGPYPPMEASSAGTTTCAELSAHAAPPGSPCSSDRPCSPRRGQMMDHDCSPEAARAASLPPVLPSPSAATSSTLCAPSPLLHHDVHGIRLANGPVFEAAVQPKAAARTVSLSPLDPSLATLSPAETQSPRNPRSHPHSSLQPSLPHFSPSPLPLLSPDI